MTVSAAKRLMFACDTYTHTSGTQGARQGIRELGNQGISQFRFLVIRITVCCFATRAHDCLCHWKGSIVSSEKQAPRHRELIRHGREEAKGYSRQGRKMKHPLEVCSLCLLGCIQREEGGVYYEQLYIYICLSKSHSYLCPLFLPSIHTPHLPPPIHTPPPPPLPQASRCSGTRVPTSWGRPWSGTMGGVSATDLQLRTGTTTTCSWRDGRSPPLTLTSWTHSSGTLPRRNSHLCDWR